MSTPMPNIPHLSHLPAAPVSQRVGERLRTAGARFHANDNIAGYLEAGELEAIEQEVACKAQALLRAMVIDVE
ncbi:MAG: hypothetical protein KGK06_04045, partial [Xanthomonadaceae bacterium]|nr:hypothetical protein [Xanthomonadaceae bacterium]